MYRKLHLVLHHNKANTMQLAVKPLALEAAVHKCLLAKRSFRKVENWLHGEALRVVQVRQLQHNKNGQKKAKCRHGKC